jgi:hypothetical protein
VRIVFGPKQSFFAWTASGFADWQNIPDGLAYVLAEWRKPGSWTAGPPRFVALGTEGSYFMIRESNDPRDVTTAWYIPQKFRACGDMWSNLTSLNEVAVRYQSIVTNFQGTDISVCFFPSILE